MEKECDDLNYVSLIEVVKLKTREKKEYKCGCNLRTNILNLFLELQKLYFLVET